MSWRLEKVSASVYRINRGRSRAGHVLLKDGTYQGKIEVEGQVVRSEASTSRDAFHEVVAQANRILICGENDATKAAAVLDKRRDDHNAAVRKTADDLNWIADQVGRPRIQVVTRRRRRVRI
jgi:hypothetical protein